MTRPSTGWYVEVDHSGGHTFSPDVVGEPERNPTVNGLPTISIPVPQSERWFDTEFEDAPMRVWKDGVRQPIDQMQRAAKGEDRTILHGRGGLELLTRVQKEYDAQQIHTAAENLITNNTSYTANVDAPNSSTETNAQVQTADTTSELTDKLQPIASTGAYEVTSTGKIQSLQSCFTQEGEGYATQSGTNVAIVAEYSAGEAVALETAGEFVEWTFTPQYDIPSGEFELFVRWDSEGTSPPSVDWSLDGTSLGTFSPDTSAVHWSGFIQLDGYLSDPGLVSGGQQHTIRADVTSGGTSQWLVDVIAPADNRFTYTLDNTNGGSSGYLDGPELYPDLVHADGEDVTVSRSVAGGRIETTTWNDTSGSQEVGFSPDEGTTWYTAANSTTHETDFTDLYGTLRARIGLSRYGSRTTATPQTGFNAQSVDAYTLYADLDDTPLVYQKRFDGQLVDVLGELARDSDSLFEYRRTGSAESVEWARPGQRPATQTADVARYEASRSTEGVYEKVGIYGKNQQVSGERFTSNHGTAVNLNHSRLQETSEVVRDLNTGTIFSRGNDYEIDTTNGQITTLTDGAMDNSTTYAIDYAYKTYGEYTASGVTNPDENVQQIPGLTSNRGCEQAARQIVKTVKEPLKEATVTIPKQPAGWEVINEIDVAELPFASTALQIKEITETPDEVVVRLGSRETISEVVSDIRTRVQAVSERV